MSSSHALTIPRLKPAITIGPYEGASDHSSPRFLLALDDQHFLVSAKARALVAALLRLPSDGGQLEQAYAAESGEHLPAPTLLALAEKTLPPALFIDAAVAPRQLPFIVSLTLLGPRLATRVTGWLSWLFTPRLAVFLVALFALLHLAVLPDALRLAHADWSARQSIMLFALFMLSGLVHELGHTSACRYFGCPHGGIGFGLYFVFPAWYADVTKAWRLQRRQRAVVDLGGVYFQAIFLIPVDAYALASGDPFAYKLAWLITFAMLFTLNPVFKFDGYWLLSDLSGLHNLHKQVRASVAALVAAVSGRRTPAVPTVRMTLLYAYALLSTCYFTYFGLFLGRELLSLRTSLLPKLEAAWQAVPAAAHAGAWELVAAAGAFAGTLAWPLLVLVATAFFLNKLKRAVSGIAAGVKEARALPAHARPV